MRKVLFALFVIVVVGSCYWIGLEMGFHKGKVEGYTEGAWTEYNSWKVFTLKTAANRWVKFYERSDGVGWDSFNIPSLEREWKEWRRYKDNEGKLTFKRNDDGITRIPASLFMSGVTSPALEVSTVSERRSTSNSLFSSR